MSAWAERPVAPAAVRGEDGRDRLGPLWLRMLTFFSVTALAALAYAQLLHEPPAGTALAVATVATVCGAGLSLGLAAVEARLPDRTSPRARATRAVLTLVVALVSVELGLLAVGVPASLVPPWRWGALASSVNVGLGQLGSWTWPYPGSAQWARLSVLMLLVPTTTVMALLFFWPARSGGSARRFLALVIAVGLALCGMTNVPGHGWRVEGLLVLALVLTWLWLPTLRRADAGRALLWIVPCAVAALIAAPLLSGSHPWISFASREAADPIAFQWDQLYGPTKQSSSQGPILLSVRASQPPRLLRVTSLDRFDGLRFIRSDAPPQTAATDIPAGAAAGWYQTTNITVAKLRSSLLVGASGLITNVTWHGGRPTSVTHAPDGTISMEGPLAAGRSYAVRSYVPEPSRAQLQAAPSAFPASYTPYTELELPLPSASALDTPQLAQEASSSPRGSQLVRAPALAGGETAALGGASATLGGATVARRILASPYGPMYALARRLAAGADTSYEVVTRVEHYLLSGRYTYDEQPPPARYPLEAFLFEDRRGYCEQFSGAMTLMLRMDGIPARVGVGFAPVLADSGGGTSGPPRSSSLTSSSPTSSSSSVWTARAPQAHAWVEVFFSGIGWVPFDPTPGGNTAANTGAGAPEWEGLVLKPHAAGSSGERDPHASGSQLPSYLAEALRAQRPHAHAGGSSKTSPWPWALLLLAVVSALGVWLRARSQRLRGAGRDAAGPEAAVSELERALRGSAWPLVGGMTLAQVAERLDRMAQPRAAAYVCRVSDRRFGRSRALTGPERSAAREERRALRRALARGKGLRGRLRALRLLPPRAPDL
jgi:protein-glutamine gamma-glutamyltransferase